MGLGLYEQGSGISATRFLASQGAKITVTDLKTAEQLAPQLKRLGALKKKIKLVLGRHRAEDFKNVDLILKNPGAPSSSPYLKIAQEKNIPIETDISLFFQLIPRKRIIGITGTRGKSTTTSLIYEIIRVIDKNAVLGGNIAKSPLAQMARVKKGGMAVLELSSWMLESLQPHHLSPYIAVVTNIYPDHLKTYRGMKDYAAAKENIFLWQNLQDCVILNRDNDFTFKMGKRAPGRRFWFSLKEFKEENGIFARRGEIYFRQDGKEIKVLKIKDIKLPGEHNLQNVMAAVCVAMIFGAKPAVIKKIVSNFKGVPNRLEFLKTAQGVKYYNDTTSTTPEAGIAALKALASKKQIVLIAGGSDKGLDFKEWAKEVKKNCKAVILLKGTGTERIKNFLPVTSYQLPVTEVVSMSEAVKEARQFAKAGDVILLSPACASFGLFTNEFDRGDQFRKIIAKF